MKGDGRASTRLDLNEAIVSATAMAEREVGDRATIVTRLDPGAHVYGNAHQLVQMFIDLIVDASCAFGGRRDGNVVVITSQRLGAYVIARVGDNARGARPLLFEITDDIVSDHDGHVHVEADLDRGSTITIVFPHAERTFEYAY